MFNRKMEPLVFCNSWFFEITQIRTNTVQNVVKYIKEYFVQVGSK